MRLIDKAKCPECRSTRTEEHGTNPGDFNWWLCRECGYNWPTKENDDEKGLCLLEADGMEEVKLDD